MKKRIVWVLVLILIVSIFAAGCAKPQQAEEEIAFPESAITAICPWSAGGGTDAILRGLAKETETFLGQSITVTNQTGGGGAVGHAAIMSANPDGYTVGMITFELNSLPPQGLVPFTYKDFDLLMRINMDPAALTVSKDAPYNTIDEFIAYAKANPGEINIGNAGPGSVWHIAAGLLAEKAGIEVTHVPFDGAAPAVTDLVGGHIQAVAVSPAEVQGQVEAGSLKILGIMSLERAEAFPDVPTFKESGIDVVFGTWRGLAVPKGTPENIKAILADSFKKAFESEAFTTFAKNSGLGLAYLNEEDFGEFLAQNAMDVDAVMKSLGLAQ